MLDLHCHLLPGVDDGPADWAGSLALAKCLVERGIQGVVATPHFLPGRLHEPAHILRLTAELQDRLRQVNLNLAVYPGAEVYLDPSVPQLLAKGRLLTLNNQLYLLLELPLDDLPRYTAEVIFQLLVQGITPILAHPERNRLLAAKPDLLADILTRGTLVQLNTGSLLGHFGPRVEKAAITFLRQGLVHFLGSDAHSHERRPPANDAARAAIVRLAGERIAQHLTWTNPALCLTGKDISRDEPIPTGMRSISQRFWQLRHRF